MVQRGLLEKWGLELVGNETILLPWRQPKIKASCMKFKTGKYKYFTNAFQVAETVSTVFEVCNKYVLKL